MASKSHGLRRGSRHRKRAVKALAAGAAIAAGTQAYALPVRFDNPSVGQPQHFNWGTSASYTDALYIQLPAAQQGNQNYPAYPSGWMKGPRSFSRSAEVPSYPSTTPALVSAKGSGFAGPTAFVMGTSQASIGFLWNFATGVMIPPAANPPWWEDVYMVGSRAKVRTPATGGYSLIPEGVPAYLGGRISNLAGGAGWHYGWIGVVRAANSGNLEAFAWGYETQVNTPIAAGAPEPGSLALLAFGVAVVARRR